MNKYGPDKVEKRYHELLDLETRPIPESYRRDSRIDTEPVLVPVERYTSREFHELEFKKLWRKVWQLACHEDDIPEIGDYLPYDIVRDSYLIIRTSKDEFKAYYNACPHRGRKLKEVRGRQADEIRCPFHGWAWELDGETKEITCEWDFSYIEKEEQRLREVKVGRWGRFIFINPDPDCEPLEDFIGDLGSHFTNLPYEKRYKCAHVSKVIKANWKVAQEAFMEGYHVIETHPQYTGARGAGGEQNCNGKYDVFGNYARAIHWTALGDEDKAKNWGPLPESSTGLSISRMERSGEVYELREDSNVNVTAPDGRQGVFTPRAEWVEGELTQANPHMCDYVGGGSVTDAGDSRARETVKSANLDISAFEFTQMMADHRRAELKTVIGSKADELPDVEFLGAYFTLFPNYHPWGSFNQINYRFRPNGDTPDEAIMEVMYLAPIPPDGDYPKAIPIHYLGEDEDFTKAPELGMTAKVFNQDVRNMAYVQQGLYTSPYKHLRLASYQETKIRHIHRLLEQWVSKPG